MILSWNNFFPPFFLFSLYSKTLHSISHLRQGPICNPSKGTSIIVDRCRIIKSKCILKTLMHIFKLMNNKNVTHIGWPFLLFYSLTYSSVEWGCHHYKDYFLKKLFKYAD